MGAWLSSDTWTEVKACWPNASVDRTWMLLSPRVSETGRVNPPQELAVVEPLSKRPSRPVSIMTLAPGSVMPESVSVDWFVTSLPSGIGIGAGARATLTASGLSVVESPALFSAMLRSN